MRMLVPGPALLLTLLTFAPELCGQVTIDAAAMPDGRVGVPYHQPIPVSNKTSSHWCGASSPAQLPPGLQVGMGCIIYGQPSSAGTYAFTLFVSGPSGMETSRQVALTVLPGVIFMYRQIDGAVGTFSSVTPDILQPGMPPHTFSLHSGQLAPGLNLNPATGAVSGTAVTGGHYEADIRATDSQGYFGVARVTMAIQGPALELNPHPVTQSELPRAKKGFHYSVQFSVSGGTAPYHFTAREYGDGLRINSAGLLSGHPERTGSFSLAVEARDAAGNSTGNRNYWLMVDAGGELDFGPWQDPKIGEPYLRSFTTIGLGPGQQVTVSGSLPPGLTATMGPGPNDGRISGTPTTPGIYDFTIRVTDASTAYVEQSLRLTLTGTSATPLSIDTNAMPDAVAGQPYSYTIPVSGGTPPYTFYFSNLPAGLTHDPQTGTVSGTITHPFNFNLRVDVQDAVLGTTHKYLPFKGTSTNLEFLTVSLGVLPETAVGWSYHRPIQVQGGPPAYTVQVTSGSLPPGILIQGSPGFSLSLGGIATQAGTFAFEITATNPDGWFGKAQGQIVVKPLTLAITPATLPDALADMFTHHNFGASGGTPPYDFSLGPGTSSSQFSINPSGHFSIHPQPAGERQVTIQVKDTQGAYGSLPMSVRIIAAGLTLTGQPPNGQIHAAYEARFEASGGTPPYQFNHYSGDLPPGLTVQADGRVTGAPSRAGTFRFSVQAKDAAGISGVRSVEVQIAGRTLSILPVILPQANSGEPYSVQFTAGGGLPPYLFRMAESPNWRAGFSISPGGLLSGSAVVSQDEEIRFRVEVEDAEGSFGSRWTSFVLKGGTGFQLGPAELPLANLGASYLVHLETSGGAPPFTFAILSGALPPGIFLQANGRISGTPQQQGAFPVTIEAKDGTGATAVRAYTLAVGDGALRILPSQLPVMVTGSPATFQLSGAGGTAPYRFEFSGGQLPPGLAMDGGGRLSGTPSAAGSYSFTIRMYDALDAMATRQYDVTVSAAGAPLLFPVVALPAMIMHVPFQFRFAASGGVPPHTFTIVDGRPPAGLTLHQDGTLQGTPAAAGRFTFTVRVTDHSGAFASQPFTVALTAGVLRLTPAVLPPAKYGLPYGVNLRGEGGREPYEFRVHTGQLPPGFTLNRHFGFLSGTPRFSRPVDFEVRVTDRDGLEGIHAFTLAVEDAQLRLGPRTLSPMPVGKPYELDFLCDGGQPPYSFTLVKGDFPRGLAMSQQGHVRGTPADAGVVGLTVGCRDSVGDSIEADFEFRVTGVSILPELLPEPDAGGVLDVQFTTSPALAGAAFTAEGLPQGLSLSPAGRLQGTPATNANFTIRAMANGGVAGYRAYTLSVRQQLTLTSATMPAAFVGRFYHARVVAEGGRPPYRLEAAPLPPGLAFAADGLLSGIPTESGELEIEFRATDAEGSVATRKRVWKASEPAFRIETTWLPAGRVGSRYEAQLVAAGGIRPNKWSVIEGELPPGIILDGDEGVLRGEPLESGTSRFTVMAQGGGAAHQTLVLVVHPRTNSPGQVTAYPAALNLQGQAGRPGRQRACVTLYASSGSPEIEGTLRGAAVNWAALEAPHVLVPGKMCLEATAEFLAPGTWPAELELTIKGGTPPRLMVPVEFHVLAGTGPLEVWPPAVERVVSPGAHAVPIPLSLHNAGAEERVYQIAARASWLTPSAEWHTLGPGASAVVPVNVDQARLTAGLHETKIEFRAAGVVVKDVPVRILTGGAAKRLSVSASHIEFSAWQGGASPPRRSIHLANVGTETVDLRVDLAGLPAWLQLGDDGCLTPPAALAPLASCAINASVDAARVPPGRHVGRIYVGGAATLLEVEVRLEVLPNEAAGPALLPPVLLSGDNEASRSVSIAGSPLRAGAVELMLPEAAWLEVSPTKPAAGPNGEVQVTLGVRGDQGLPAGSHHATVLLHFANGERAELPVTLFVPDPRCEARPNLVFLEPAAGFRATLGEPLTIQVLATKCDGKPAEGPVFATFENRIIVLTPGGGGLFMGSVTPSHPSEAALLSIGREGDIEPASVVGKVRGVPSAAPLITTVKSGAGLVAPVVPGAPVRIEGLRFAESGRGIGTLAAELDGVRVTLGGRALLLSYLSSDRIDAFVPPDAAHGDTAQLIVSARSGESPPFPVLIAAAHPAIYTADESGKGPALAAHPGTHLPVTEASPAAPGALIRIFAAGLASSAPLEVLVDDDAAAVEFTELLTGFPGVWEVHFRTPAITGEARLAVLRLKQGSLISAPTGLFVRP